MGEIVNLVIFPSVQEGQDLAVVKKKLAKTLSIDAEKVEEWFSKDKPTTILKDIDEAVADRYVTAIMKCGAECNTHPTGSENLSLVPKSIKKDTDLFVCPSCEHDEDIPRGTKLEQCPKCGLVIATWEEQMAEEAEQDKIRKRLLREARLDGDGKADKERKRKELEVLKIRQLELMEELEMKTPSALWRMLEKRPVSMSTLIGFAIIFVSALTFYFIDQHLDQQKAQELIAASPGDEIRGVAPILGAAVQLRQNGNGRVVTEIADISVGMRGQASANRVALVHAAEQMMKGAEPEKFVASASTRRLPGNVAKLAEGETEAITVNTDTIGGVSGLIGVVSFETTTLDRIAPKLLEDGHENLLQVLAENRMKPDPINPDMEIIVEALDEMDGSMIVDLMNTLSKDREWDQFLASQVIRSLNNQDYERASDLSNRIRNPVAKIGSLNEMMSSYLLEGDETETKLLMARVQLEVDKIEDPDIRARTLISIGESLGSLGSKGEPEASLLRVATMAAESDNQNERAVLHARLAVAYMQQGNKVNSRVHFAKATMAAGQVEEPADRISVFTQIAMRYFDVRNTTLANEILSEAEILAATQLEPIDRARVFAEIAMARGYLGDLVGANMAINNAAQGQGRQQLLAKLAEMLIGLDRYFQALSVMDSIDSNVESVRLEVRIISSFIHSNRQADARLRLPGAINRAGRIKEPGERGLLMSQLARLSGRVGDKGQSQALFTEVLGLSVLLQDRKAELNKGLVALNLARIFQFEQSQSIVERLEDIVVKDPLGNEINGTKRTVSLLLPEFMPVKAED